MQTTYQLNVNEIDSNFFEAFKKLFSDKTVKITVEEINKKSSEQPSLWNSLQKLEQKYPPFLVDPSIDLSALANEVNL